MAKQNMSIIELLLIKQLRGEKIEIIEDSGIFETIKTIQKMTMIDEVVIETDEGSKVTLSMEKIYAWEIDVKKDRVKPEKRLNHKKKF